MIRHHQLSLLLFLFILMFVGCNDNGSKEKETEQLKKEAIRKEADFKQTCNTVLQSILNKDTATFNALINPGQGLYIVYRTGAMDAFIKIEEIGTENTISSRFELMESLKKEDLDRDTLQFAKSPVYDCEGPIGRDEDGWSKRGYFADSINKYTPVSSVIAFNEKIYQEKNTEKDITTIKSMEQISRKVVFTGKEENGDGVTFYLMYVDGKWWISILDWMSTDCSA